MKNLKKRKSQQLVEFLLVAPFMIIILGILTEYAYALNVNMTLHTGLKSATSSLYSQMTPNNSTGIWTHSQIKSIVLNDLGSYLLSNNTSVLSENNLSVDYVIIGENAVFMAKYTYLTAFTLPNAYFKILPDTFSFCATVPVPASFLKPNNYDNIDSETLDKVWNNNSFSSLGDFNDSKKGIMNETGSSSSDSVNKILFFLPVSVTSGSLIGHQCYYLTKWSGVNLSGSNSAPWIADLTDNKVYVCNTDLTTCNEESTNVMNKLGGMSSLIFYHGFIGAQPENSCESSFLDTCWIKSTGSKISDSSEDGVLKQALTLTDSVTKKSSGNFDDIEISNYNYEAQPSKAYIPDTFGSISIVATGADKPFINTLIGTNTPPNIKYDNHFGTKVN